MRSVAIQSSDPSCDTSAGIARAHLFTWQTTVAVSYTAFSLGTVDATAYAAKLPSGQSSVIVLYKGAVTDLEVELDFGRGVSGAVETEILHAPALDSRETHITTSTKTDSLKQGKCSVTIPHATGVRLTLT